MKIDCVNLDAYKGMNDLFFLVNYNIPKGKFSLMLKHAKDKVIKPQLEENRDIRFYINEHLFAFFIMYFHIYRV